MIKRKLIILIAAVVAVMGLAGCSGQTGSGIPFSQAISGEGPQIWFECQNKIEQPEDETEYIIEGTEDSEPGEQVFGRETKVIWIKVYNEGKLSTYSCLESVNLGFFSKMTDEEILKELDSNKDVFQCGQKDKPYEIYLYTDAAGQEVVFEGVPSLIKEASDSEPLNFMTLISKESVPAFQVYDSYYGGYSLYNYDESLLKEACLVKRCEKGAAFGLDNMELEGAVLDYKTPEEMLHERNIELKENGKSSGKSADSEKSKGADDTEAGESADEADTSEEGDA